MYKPPMQGPRNRSRMTTIWLKQNIAHYCKYIFVLAVAVASVHRFEPWER